MEEDAEMKKRSSNGSNVEAIESKKELKLNYWFWKEKEKQRERGMKLERWIKEKLKQCEGQIVTTKETATAAKVFFMSKPVRDVIQVRNEEFKKKI